MNPDQTLGQSRMHEAICGDEELAPVLGSLLGCKNLSHLFGAVGVLVAFYVAARDIGMVWKPCNGGASAFMSGSKNQMLISMSESLNDPEQDTKILQLAELVSAVNLFRSQGVVWTPDAVQRPAPLEVRISSLPARIIETTVARDADMEIIKTTQIEQDVFSAIPKS